MFERLDLGAEQMLRQLGATGLVVARDEVSAGFGLARVQRTRVLEELLGALGILSRAQARRPKRDREDLFRVAFARGMGGELAFQGVQ